MAVLDDIKKLLQEIRDEIPKAVAKSLVAAHQIRVQNGLSDISPKLGLVQAGEFRVGNGKDPTRGFSGGRFGYPGFTYGDTDYFLAGVLNDEIQVGLSLVDGKIYAGGGKVIIDENGITVVDPTPTVGLNLEVAGETTSATPTGSKVMLLPHERIPPYSGIDAASLEVTESTSSDTYKPLIPILRFDASTDEGAMWIFRVPTNFTTMSIKGLYYMEGANTSKNVGWVVYLSSLSDGDTSATANSFDTANVLTTACPDAAGVMDEFSGNLSNVDSLTGGDWACILLRRNTGVSNDAAGDANLMSIELSFI